MIFEQNGGKITLEKARFTVITDRIIRMEYAEDGIFEDEPTLTFVERGVECADFSAWEEEGLVIESPYISLRYLGGEFTGESLSAVIRDGEYNFTWNFGKEDRENLLGTTRTLDNVTGRETLMSRMENGLVSRSGWTIVDDTKNLLFVNDDSHWGGWVKERRVRNGKYLDLYLFGFGHNYKECLRDYSKIAGKIPLPPRWAFGYWWSRYWQYSDSELKDLVRTIRLQNIPMDVLIVDMDWHDTCGLGENGGVDEVGQAVGWTGYTWKRELFPDPEGFLEWCHLNKLKTALNLHPASGIRPYEKCYGPFTKEYGWKEEGVPVPFKIDEKAWADAYFKCVIAPLEEQGVDFWWLDWQQWLESKWTSGLSNTFWLNHTFNHHSLERGMRPMIYHRWGGLGSHRYQTGFSGDTAVSWDVLRLLPWFTATASNVGYGYWGHDIGGHHMPFGRGHDGDLFTRWLQSAVFTPVFKTHSSRTPEIERRIWSYPEYRDYLFAAIRLRYTLAPYIYSAAREAYDTAVSICRPLYYDYPEEQIAYDNTLSEMLFGNDILAATIWQKCDSVTKLSPSAVWLPCGMWYDVARGMVLEGNRILRTSYALFENPFFVRSGAVIPQYPETITNLKEQHDEFVLSFIPGAEGGRTSLYEDDGTSADYAERFAQTEVSWKQDGCDISVSIGARVGDYDGAPTSRLFTLRFPCQMPPKSIQVGGKSLPFSRFAAPDTWSYDGERVALVVTLARRDVNEEINLSITTMPGARALYGKRAFILRAKEITAEMKLQYCEHISNLAMLPTYYLSLASLGSELSAFPERAPELLAKFDENFALFSERFAPIAAELDAGFVRRINLALGFASEERRSMAFLSSLKTDYRFDATNVGNTPAFSWLVSGDSAYIQDAYEIEIDGMWSSGVVFSPKSTGIVYAGLRLSPHTKYNWRVRTRNCNFEWTQWAESTFTTGDLANVKTPFFPESVGTLRLVTDNAQLQEVIDSAPSLFEAVTSCRTDGAIYIPHTLYSLSGDMRYLSENYADMEAYIAAETPAIYTMDSVALSKYVVSCWLMKEISICLSSTAKEEYYFGLENDGRALFHKRFMDENGYLASSLTSSSSLAWAIKARFINWIDTTQLKDAEARLFAALERENWDLDDELISILPYVLSSECGRPDLVWNYALSATPKGKWQKAAIVLWLMRTAAGITEDDLRSNPGFIHFTLAPSPDVRARSLSATYESPYGEIMSAWHYNADGKTEWSYSIPPKTKAFVNYGGKITEVSKGE